MNPDIGNPKFLYVTGFNEIRTLRFMFPNPGTNIPATKKPEKPRKHLGYETKLTCSPDLGGSLVSVRRIAGSLGAEDGRFSGFGGFFWYEMGRMRMGLRVWGFGRTKPRGVDSRGVSIGLGWEIFVMEWGVKR